MAQLEHRTKAVGVRSDRSRHLLNLGQAEKQMEHSELAAFSSSPLVQQISPQEHEELSTPLIR